MAPSVTKFPIANEANTAATWQSIINEMGGNFISSGLTPTNGGGLNLTIQNGVVFCGGVRHTLTGGPFTFVLWDSTTNYVFYNPATMDFYKWPVDTRPTNAVKIATVTVAGGIITNPTTMDTREGQLGFPSGIITMWSGSTTTIPLGWQLCNGLNGTPNLQNKFVVGAGLTYNPADIGGEVTHTLTIAEMPAHTHTYTSVTGDLSNIERGNDYTWTGATTDSTGGGAAHNNLPPYYSICYIMRI